MKFRPATLDDCDLLAELNHQLIHDEGHRNPMTVKELEQRMRNWLAGEYRAVVYEDSGEMIAYALFQEQPEQIYLRQLFVSEIVEAKASGVGQSKFFALKFGPRTSD
jgi:hypothetical protein